MLCVFYLLDKNGDYKIFMRLMIHPQLRSLSNPSEIAHNEDILRIFLMACEVRTVKLSIIGLSCLQKLISHDAVSPSALKEILSTLKDVSLDNYLDHLHFDHIDCILVFVMIRDFQIFLL